MSVQKKIYWLLLISFAIRAFLAAYLEFGNDEVYYWTYALYPDWSHFDHPPMVGWVMQFFSLNLLFDSEFFLRLASVVFTTINTFLIFLIGKKIKDEVTGFYAALLYTASIYAFVITGIFILPDTPQNLFWMLGIYLMVRLLDENQSIKSWNLTMIGLGLVIGLGMISKYTSVFLWVGFGLYVLFYKRIWLKNPALYLALIFSIVCTLPVILWNFNNDFISFSFQGERINIFSSSLRLDYFFRELFGQIAYNNPINFVLVVLSVFALFKGKNWLRSDYQQIILFISLPLIGIFLVFSLFRPTLPHWTGPAYSTLILLAAARLASLKSIQFGKIFIPTSIKYSLSLLAFILVLGSLQIKFGLISIPDKNAYHQLGRNDVTLDMYGWRALKPAFEKVREQHINDGSMKFGDALIAENWFPLANLDYYVAHPLGINVLGLGKADRLHKYLWINKQRGGFTLGADYWYLTNSRNYKHPDELYNNMFQTIIPADTIEIMRGGKPASRVFVFLLKDLQVITDQPIK